MEPSDLSEALPVLRRCWHEMQAHRYGHQWHETTVRARLERLLASPDWGFFVAAQGHRLLGVVAGCISAQLLDARARELTEAIWHSDPDLPRLTRARIMVKLWSALERFAAKHRAEGIRCSVPHHFPEGLKRWLERRAVAGEQTYYQRITYGA